MNKYVTDSHLNYLLHIPGGYKCDTEKRWPLIVFLHGVNERDKSLKSISSVGLFKKIKSMPHFPFFVIAPQCPVRTYWDRAKPAQKVKMIIDTLIVKHKIDERRVYLTGFSMGGFGTWYIANEFPDVFAAIAPICGGGDPEMIKKIAHIPAWVFHGKKDRIVSVKKSLKMIDAYKDAGCFNVKYTIYPEKGHDCWDTVYSNPQIYDWFLEQKSLKGSTEIDCKLVSANK